ncbi:PAPA-1-domain-containing protein [Bimuria novae-zelandiae CBS 107.79]|uniref:PAPA-1-domain-containing protein n=1 Tax=Bimuria novae-zelandiae CBS 107.79 TaxID=1447943 RepID=A0A6A5UQL4_9PLEO|nr:PAPA-1-domain-containing protein [Bimuria novae-zelandiae CBS 107.79]
MPRLRSRANLTAPSAPPPTASSTRPRRNTASRAPPAAVIQRSSPEESRQSLNLTVKAAPGKLREATGGRASTAVSSRNIVAGKRARPSRVVREVDSDDEEEVEDDAEKVDAMDVDDDDEDVDAEGDEDEDMDAEGDEDDEMEVTPAPRIVVPSNKNVPVKQKVAQDSVEAKEMALDDDDDDDDELSELESDLEGEDEDAEGEDEDAEGEEDDEIAAPNDDDEEMDSDEDLSRDQTPDLSKMTRRQQAMVVQGADDGLMALSNETQKKKHLTAEEITSRRAEMARRRKNLSEKRNEEEKMDTINRLLKKQPPKRGRKALAQEDTESGQPEDEKREVEKANPIFIRYKQNKNGTSLGVPEEWLQAPAGDLFKGKLARPISTPYSGRMVEEVS